jgi:formylglycine-generating enzyme required for sulfatase activity
MGERHKAHRVRLAAYAISRVPITNAQYQLFVQATEYEAPQHWTGKRAPRGKEIHPVVNVSWHDALAYCRWLSQATGKPITLPSEAEWEKAARGAEDERGYPWGDDFDASRCNIDESGFLDTTPIGIFLNGASPYGCLDMAGNVWEWTRSRHAPYPYRADDGREPAQPEADDEMVLRGGSWGSNRDFARCAYRLRLRPSYRYFFTGFRVVLRSPPVGSL